MSAGCTGRGLGVWLCFGLLGCGLSGGGIERGLSGTASGGCGGSARGLVEIGGCGRGWYGLWGVAGWSWRCCWGVSGRGGGSNDRDVGDEKVDSAGVVGGVAVRGVLGVGGGGGSSLGLAGVAVAPRQGSSSATASSSSGSFNSDPIVSGTGGGSVISCSRATATTALVNRGN